MEKKTIAKLARQMTSREDLLALLNRIKQDEMYENGMSDKFHPFTMKLLLYYCNPNNVFHRYSQFKIKKKSGGFRTISAPRNRSFTLMLRYVNEIFKAVEVENFIFATYLLSLDAKKSPPLLVT